VVAVAAFVLLGASVEAQTLPQAASTAHQAPSIDPAFRADIERLIEMTGASARGTQMASAFVDAFVNGLKQTQQSMSPRVIDIIGEVMTSEFQQAFNGPEIYNRMIALYAKYFTQEDVKGMIAFYQSELGKKTIAVMPSITREGMAIGEQWAQANMPRILERLAARLKSEGLLPADSPLSSR